MIFVKLFCLKTIQLQQNKTIITNLLMFPAKAAERKKNSRKYPISQRTYNMHRFIHTLYYTFNKFTNSFSTVQMSTVQSTSLCSLSERTKFLKLISNLCNSFIHSLNYDKRSANTFNKCRKQREPFGPLTLPLP